MNVTAGLVNLINTVALEDSTPTHQPKTGQGLMGPVVPEKAAEQAPEKAAAAKRAGAPVANTAVTGLLVVVVIVLVLVLLPGSRDRRGSS